MKKLNYNQIVLFIYVCWIILSSLIALILFFKDKKKAIKGDMRIKERTLLGLSSLGGGLGALIGRVLAHHKTDKKYFSFIICLSTLLQLVVLAVLIYLAVGGNING